MGSWGHSWVTPKHYGAKYAPVEITVHCRHRPPQRYQIELAREQLASDDAFAKYLTSLRNIHAQLNAWDDSKILADVYIAENVSKCAHPIGAGDHVRVNPYALTSMIVIDPYDLGREHDVLRAALPESPSEASGRLAVAVQPVALPTPQSYHLAGADVDCGHAHCSEYQAREGNQDAEEDEEDADEGEGEGEGEGEEAEAPAKQEKPAAKTAPSTPQKGSYRLSVTSNQPAAAYDACMRALVAATIDECLPLMEINVHPSIRVIQVSAKTCCIKHCAEGVKVGGMSREEYTQQCILRRSGGTKKQMPIFLGSAVVNCSPDEVVLSCSYRLEAETAEIVFMGAQKAYAGCDCLYCRKK